MNKNVAVSEIGPESIPAKFPINQSGIYPIEYKVLVKPKELDDKFEGTSILRAETTKERDQHAQVEGTLVAVSPIAFTFDHWPEDARKPEIGDQVLYAKYSGAEVEGRDGKKYRIINDQDIGAIFTS